MGALKNIDTLSAMLIVTLIAVELFAIKNIAAADSFESARSYFLGVTQGSAELVIFPGNVKVMTDAGPDASGVALLEKILPGSDTYIDVAIISAPIAENFGGYSAILDHYRIGVFVYNGREPLLQNAAWTALIEKINSLKIPFITVGAGDRIRYGENSITILSPDAAFARGPDLTDTDTVQFIKTKQWTALFAGKIGSNVKNFLPIKALEADIVELGGMVAGIKVGKAETIEMQYSADKKKLILRRIAN